MMHPVGRPWWAGIYCGDDDGDVGQCNANERRRRRAKKAKAQEGKKKKEEERIDWVALRRRW